MSMVSSIVTLESQSTPGIVPKNTLATKAVFSPCIRLVNSNTIKIAKTEKVTATSRPATSLTPKTKK